VQKRLTSSPLVQKRYHSRWWRRQWQIWRWYVKHGARQGHTTPQPFYGPFLRDHPGEPVQEKWTSGPYGARED